MEFSGFNLTHQPFLAKSHSKAKMNDESSYSYPLTGHLEGGNNYFKKPPWGCVSPSKIAQHFQMTMPTNLLPPPPKLEEFGKNMLSYVVGGFVGSKSQRNDEKREPFPIGDLILEMLSQPPKPKKEKATSSQNINFLENVSHLIMDFTSQLDCDMSASNSEGIGTSQCEQPTRTTIRLLSECSTDSNDSDYIVFDVADECCQISEEEDDEWPDDNIGDEDEEEDDDVDAKYIEALKTWNEYYGAEPCPTPKQRKVRFDDNVTVHVMHVWNYASRAARLGPWETAARDRSRFAARIVQTEKILSPILSDCHREKIKAKLGIDR